MPVQPSQIVPPTYIPAGSTPLVLYTVPAGYLSVQIKKFTLTSNVTDGSTANPTNVYLVTPGGTPNNGNLLVFNKSVGPAATVELVEAEGHILPTGSTIQALTGHAGQVSAIVSGVLFS